MIQIDTTGSIILGGKDTGLKLTQRRDGTVVYTPERRGLGRINRIVGGKVVQVVDAGVVYKEHAMPFARYSTAHDSPHKPGESYDPKITAGRAQLEVDVIDLLRILGQE